MVHLKKNYISSHDKNRSMSLGNSVRVLGWDKHRSGLLKDILESLSLEFQNNVRTQSCKGSAMVPSKQKVRTSMAFVVVLWCECLQCTKVPALTTWWKLRCCSSSHPGTEDSEMPGITDPNGTGYAHCCVYFMYIWYTWSTQCSNDLETRALSSNPGAGRTVLTVMIHGTSGFILQTIECVNGGSLLSHRVIRKIKLASWTHYKALNS